MVNATYEKEWMNSDDILSLVYAITFLLCPMWQKQKYLKYDLTVWAGMC